MMPDLPSCCVSNRGRGKAQLMQLGRGIAASCVVLAAVALLGDKREGYGRVWGVGGMGMSRGGFKEGAGRGMQLSEAAVSTADPLQTSKHIQPPAAPAKGNKVNPVKRLLTREADKALRGGGVQKAGAGGVGRAVGKANAAVVPAREKAVEGHHDVAAALGASKKEVSLVKANIIKELEKDKAGVKASIAGTAQALADEDSPAVSGGDDSKKVIGKELSNELSHIISKIVSKVAARKEQIDVVEQPSSGKVLAAAKTHMLTKGADAATPAGTTADTTVPNIADWQGGVENGMEIASNASKVQDVGGADLGDGVLLNKVAYKKLPLTYFAWITSSVCVLLTIIIASHLILKHLEYYQHPETQKYVVRILFMAPIYAFDALLGLTFVGWMTTYIDVFRDCYEAFTIYNFLKLLVVMLGGERTVVDMLSHKPQMKMVFPLTWTDPWDMGAEMFYNCKYGALQYVIVKPCCAIITFVSGAAGLYGPNSFSLARLHFYVFLASNTSQMWAIYCLVTFYFATREELAPFNPVLKFVIVKAVVFFCFWQGMVLGVVAYLGYIPETTDFSSDNIVEAVQEVLVCIEMVLVAILFHKAFPVEEFADVAEIAKERAEAQRGLRAKIQEIRANAADPFRVNDIRDDISTYGDEQKDRLIGVLSQAHASVTGVGRDSARSDPGRNTRTHSSHGVEEDANVYFEGSRVRDRTSRGRSGEGEDWEAGLSLKPPPAAGGTGGEEGGVGGGDEEEGDGGSEGGKGKARGGGKGGGEW